MGQLQSIVALLSLVVLAAGPGVLAHARRKDAGLMSGREAVARHLYGQAVAWDATAMDEYDGSALVQATWLAEADRMLR